MESMQEYTTFNMEIAVSYADEYNVTAVICGLLNVSLSKQQNVYAIEPVVTHNARCRQTNQC
jgi:hypothetical protein